MKRIALFLTIALGACQAAPHSEHSPRPTAAQSHELAPGLRDAQSLEGRAIEAQIYGVEGPVVLFLASIHGDENAGTQLVEELGRRLDADPSLLNGRRALLVPVVNPDGVALGTRRNAHGVDLNRNFNAHNFQSSLYRGQNPLSEPESKFVNDLIRTYKPERIISFHQEADRIDFDGPGAALAHRLAGQSPLEVHRMGERPGSLGAWAGGDLRIATLAIELPRDADELDAEAAWETYGALLTGALED